MICVGDDRLAEMDDENRRRLQSIYNNIDANSGESARILQEAAAAASRTSSAIRDTNSNASIAASAAASAAAKHRLLQQNRIQQELARSSMFNRLSHSDQLRLQIRNDPTQQFHGLDNYPTNTRFNSSGSLITGLTDVRHRMEELIRSDLALQHGYANLNQGIAAEMITGRSIQHQRPEDKVGEPRNQHREVMLKAALNLQQQNATNFDDINNLLAESNATSSLQFLENSQYNTSIRRQLMSPLLPGSGSSRVFSEADVAQLLPSSDGPSNLGHRILIDDYIRSREHDRMLMKELDPAYQKQQFDDLYGQSNRLALLLQQRQRLEMQIRNESNPMARNKSLKNDEVEVQEQTFVKIRKVETYLEKPKRPLSAYNIFFREQRQLLLGENDGEDSTGKISSTTKAIDDMEDQKPAALELDTGVGTKKRKRGKPHHKVTFEQMAKTIGQRWKELETDETKKKVYQDVAAKEKKRYQLEMIAWRKQRNAMSSMKRKNGDDNSSE